jgi:dissimilatory sulfite reductase (desulfoviridin) alpha/beta subunit
MNQQNHDTFSIAHCRGFTNQGCPRAALPAPGLALEIEHRLEAEGWPAVLERQIKKPKAHERLRIALAACPNGCSRPHIHDFALIGAKNPVFPTQCSLCGACVAACPDKALSLEPDHEAPYPDHDLCLQCGRCINVCPQGLIKTGSTGWKILVGGRLGRHPRLAEKLPGLWKTHAALDILSLLIAAVGRYDLTRVRISDVFQELGPKIVSTYGLQREIK